MRFLLRNNHFFALHISLQNSSSADGNTLRILTFLFFKFGDRKNFVADTVITCVVKLPLYQDFTFI